MKTIDFSEKDIPFLGLGNDNYYHKSVGKETNEQMVWKSQLTSRSK